MDTPTLNICGDDIVRAWNEGYAAGASNASRGQGGVHFVIYGEPKGKGRPRFARRGKYVSSYTPQETQNYEAFVKMCYVEAANGRKFYGPVEADIQCYFGVPKSVSEKKRRRMIDGGVPCTKLPDTDNVAKAVLDALNTIAYDDDRQVVSLIVMKRYGETPRVEVTLQDVV